MASTRDLLERFRPAGAPGAAAPAGVPSERAAGLREELLPVLALLEPTEAQVEAVLRESVARADRVRADASARVASQASQSRLRADEARAEAVARQRRRSQDESAARLDAAAREAAALDARVRARLPQLVQDVLDAVRADLTGPKQASPTDKRPAR